MSRSRDQVIWDFVQEWWAKADGDLRAAEHLLTLPQEDYFAAAFHAQQAAEQFSQAFLVRHQAPFSKTHDIQKLLDLAAQFGADLKLGLASATMLTPFGVEFRCPGDQVADLAAAREAVREAQQVREVIRQRLQSYLGQGRP